MWNFIEDLIFTLIDNMFYVICICIILLVLIAPVIMQSEKIEKAKQAIGSGSKVYLDGQEVNPEVIVLEEYKVTIRDNVIILND